MVSYRVLGVWLFLGGVVCGVWYGFAVLRNDDIVVVGSGCEGFCEMVDFWLRCSRRFSIVFVS
jgi:lipid-A-disaccharide synthase-like uncharacterized protein